MPAASGQVGCFEVAKGIGATNRWAKPVVTEQVIVDPLPPNLSDRDDRIIFIRFKQVDVVAPLQVIQRKRFARQELVQEPHAPGIFAGRFGSDIFKEIFLPCLLKQDAEDGKIRPIILEREFDSR